MPKVRHIFTIPFKLYLCKIDITNKIILILILCLVSQLPRSRIGEATFTFVLTAEQATEISMNRSLVANGKFEYEVQVSRLMNINL